jgi:hypothetical protein
MNAVESGDCVLVKLMIDRGADLSIRSQRTPSETALDKAWSKTDVSMAHLLSSKGASFFSTHPDRVSYFSECENWWKRRPLLLLTRALSYSYTSPRSASPDNNTSTDTLSRVLCNTDLAFQIARYV